MTREEAIEKLKNTAWLGSNNDRESTEEAVRMAIEALNLQPTCNQLATTEGDLISRQDAINVVNKHWYPGTNVCKADATEREIIMLPSADAVQIPIKLEKRYPQSRDEDITDAFMRGYLAGRSSADRPTGEWVKDDLGSVICSECKGYRRDNRVSHTNFCNRCGAKMGGDTE